jgi:hypothetical protein
VSDQTASYATDPDHNMHLELVDTDGRLLVSIPVNAPLHEDARAAITIQARLSHPDGCSRILARFPLPPY